jgi:hypothetical protein
MSAGFKVCAALFGAVLATTTASLGSEYPPAFAITGKRPGPGIGADAPGPMACCKVCTKGKACGNSCISRGENCHQPPGCACDG